jgi:hypothetical protein
MADLPNGPLPDVSVLKPRVQAILEELGVASRLRKRLEAEFNVNMEPHVDAVNAIVYAVAKEPVTAVAVVDTAKALATQAPIGQVTKLTSAKCKKPNCKKAKRKEAKRQKARNAKKNEPKHAFLSAEVIFANERRPAIMEVARAKGGQVNAADIETQIIALWRAETDKEKYEFLETVSKERYVNDHIIEWEDSAAAHGVGKRTAAPKKRAAACEDAAQTPPAVSPRWTSTTAVASVYSDAISYLRPFCLWMGEEWDDPEPIRSQRTRWAALCLLAAGRGPLHAPTCNHTLRVASGKTAWGQSLLRRAFVLLGPGELQELHEMGPAFPLNGAFDFILPELEQEAVGRRLQRGGAPRDAPVSRALASLRVIKAEGPLPPTLIQQFAGTLTELECYGLFEPAHRALSTCTLLESLTFHEWDWDDCPPAAWLGLSTTRAAGNALSYGDIGVAITSASAAGRLAKQRLAPQRRGRRAML